MSKLLNVYVANKKLEYYPICFMNFAVKSCVRFEAQLSFEEPFLVLSPLTVWFAILPSSPI